MEEFSSDLNIVEEINDTIYENKQKKICNELENTKNLYEKVSHNKRIDLLKDLLIRNVIKSHENAESQDWIILNDKLKGDWQTFKLFGFNIDDSTLIKKTLAVITGIIMLLHLDNNFNF